MAEALLSTLAESLIGRLITYAEQEMGKILGVEDELNKLKQTVRSIQAVLRDADQQQALNYQDQDWIDNLKEALCYADDLLDDFATEARKRQVMRGNKVTKEVRLFFSCTSNQLIYRHNMGKKLGDINTRLDHIVKNRQTINLPALPRPKIRDPTDSSLPEVVIGREVDKQAIIYPLLGSKDEDRVIPIIGISGLGKTTLAQLVFNDMVVRNNFELPLWICVSQSFDIKLILQKSLEFINKSKTEDLDVETLRQLVDDNFKEKKYLLVLDDVWNEDQDIWDGLMSKLKGGKSGSKIIITTRLEKAAEFPGTKIHRLEGLFDLESWNLLKQLAFSRGQLVPENLRVEIGMKIVENCYGIPLVIRVVGRLLNGKTANEWLSFKENELCKIAQNEHKVLETLKLSYDHLPPHLKDCFSYCSLFPKDYEINVETLVYLWIAQGLVRVSKSQKQLEDVGREYFMELCWRSFFQDVKKDTLGNFESCRMHDLVHDVASIVSGVGTTILDSNGDYVNEKTLHVSLEFNLDVTWQISSSLCRAKNLRTFLLPEQRLASDVEGLNNANIEAICSNFRRLRALDLHDLGIDQVSSSIEKLKHLRYLDTSKNERIEFLPVDITKLQNLNVLKLSGCSQLKELPKHVTRLVDLRCLNCEECENLSHMPRGLGRLTSLQTLTCFVVAKDSCVSKNIGLLSELGTLNNLHGTIKIKNLRFVKDDKSESALAKMQDKQHLQTLILTWDEFDNADANTRLDEKVLESLKPHKKLKKLEVDYYSGVVFPSWLSSITNLVEIYIFRCSQLQHLPPLDQLPFLRDFYLFELNSLIYIDDRPDSFRVGKSVVFPSLEKLRIRNCHNLNRWWKKENDVDNATTTIVMVLPKFPRLSELIIESCPKWNFMPECSMDDGCHISSLGKVRFLNFFTHFSNLVKICVSGCQGCRYFPSMDQIPSLEEINIYNALDLEYIGTEEIKGNRRCGEGSMFFPSLKKLWLLHCPNLKGWWMARNDDDNDDEIIKTTKATTLPQFPTLSDLRIIDCPNVTEIPLFPGLDGELILEDACIKPFLRRTNLTPAALTNLRKLEISGSNDLEYIGIETFPFLERVEIQNCPNLKSWWKKKNGIDSTAATTMEFPHFPALSMLLIFNCPNFTQMPLFPLLDDVLSLFIASIEPLEKTMKMMMTTTTTTSSSSSSSSSTLALHPLLRELVIAEIYDVESLPAMQNLTSLRGLEIIGCPNLKSLPEGLHCLSNLEVLRIIGCPLLSERCKKQEGVDWPNIAHVPKIIIDHQMIQGK